ncbi:transcriptional regulator, partial [Streptomyces lunaelactis]|nr:transcriptional regulator [Streptomyces lunaelactis]
GSAAPSASPSGSPSASPSPSRAATPPATVGVPLRVGISSYNWDSPCGQYYLLDQEPDAVPPPPAPQDNRGWARALGGVDGGHMQLQLTATGKSADSVVLNAVHVRVVGRNAPLDWKAYSMGDGCGSGVTPQTFDVDLDAGHPLVKPVAGQNGDTVVPAKDFPYKVASNDPQVLNLDVHTEGHDISWYLELDWSSGDRRGTVRVDDGGEPFRTSAIEGRTEYGYWPDKGEWVARSGQ